MRKVLLATTALIGVALAGAAQAAPASPLSLNVGGYNDFVAGIDNGSSAVRCHWRDRSQVADRVVERQYGACATQLTAAARVDRARLHRASYAVNYAQIAVPRPMKAISN